MAWPVSRPPTRRRPGYLWLLLLLAVLGTAWMVGNWRSALYTPVGPRAVAARGELAADEKSTIELFEQTSPSVVYITNLGVRRDWSGLDVMQIPQGTGSGIVWDDRGYILTNYHVIEGAQAAEVMLSDQSSWPARLVGVEADKDVAVLKIEAPRDHLRPLAVGTSKDLKVGQKVFAIGNPFGLDHTLTTGIISALGRQIRSVTNRPITGVIQTDAVINPGNSGGPLLDSAGRLIGVNTAIYSPEGGQGTFIGIGFAVPVDTVNLIVPQIISHGRVVRPGLGVVLGEDRLAKALGVTGVLVLGVARGSGAEAAGLRATFRDESGRIHVGDVIQAIDGQAVTSKDDVADRLEPHQVGETVKVTVSRGDETVDLPIRVQALTR